jgi:hypothetical protein
LITFAWLSINISSPYSCNRQAAIQLLEELASNGYPMALYRMPICYFRRFSLPVAGTKGIAIFEDLCAKGFNFVIHKYGIYNIDGKYFLQESQTRHLLLHNISLFQVWVLSDRGSLLFC